MQVPDEKYRLDFPGLKGLHGWITVDDKALEIYGVEESSGKLVAYVEAKEGKPFKVHFADMRGMSPPPQDHVLRLFVDGTKVNGLFVGSDETKFSQPADYVYRFETFQGRQETSTTILPFLFSKLATTDDDDNACTDENVIKGLGSVQLKYWRLWRPETPNARWRFDLLDRADSPLSTIEFRYRSRAILQFEDLIPASPDPSPSPQPASSPEPQPAVTASPAVAGPSNPRRSSSSTLAGGASRSPPATDDTSRIAKLEAELEALRRRERMAELERELEELRNGGAVASGSGSSSSQATGGGASGKKRVKPELGETDVEVLKRVKKEEGEKIEQEKRENKKKGKPLEVIDLCDSD